MTNQPGKKKTDKSPPAKTGPISQPLHFAAADPALFAENIAKIAAQSQELVRKFLDYNANRGPAAMDPLNIGGAFFEMTARLMADPGKLIEAQMDLWKRYAELWHNMTQRALGEDAKAVAEPEKTDKRFRDAAWQENQIFDFIKQSYLVTARWMQNTVHGVQGLDEKTAKKVDFYTRQFVDAMAPTNFIMTNPEVLRATFETNGQNLVEGLENMLEDLERGKGQLAIRMTDMASFRLGENIAVTPGKVIHQSDLVQLIQYEPATEQVHKRPLLIIPPWINKYYILDLKPDNSMVKWLTAQGFTVFVVSWVNPDEHLAKKSFADYMDEGIFDVVEVITRATGAKDINAVGYCLGGTLLSAALAMMAEKKDTRIASATLFAAQTDFSEAGELSVFIDEDQLDYIEGLMRKQGYLGGREMGITFNMLRANDLIWSFVVNNYLLGKDPFPFDLLFWNADTTRMPAKMHSYYLRHMYQRNELSKPSAIRLKDTPIDLGKIKIPLYIQASREDHIAPFVSVYKTTRLVHGLVRFVLAGSGHIAGVINPPTAQKYSHWIRPDGKMPATAMEWLTEAEEHPGSWWPDWKEWLAERSGPMVPARNPGKGIEDAPGSFVRMRAD